MKLKTKLLMVVSLISVLMFSTLFVNPISVLGTSDVQYTFENDNLYNSTNPIYDDSLNVRNQSFYDGNYPATYSFENDIIGNTPIDWNILGTPTSGIINSLEGHNQILKVVSDGGWDGYYDGFGQKTSEIVELWINVAEADTRHRTQLSKGTWDSGRGVIIEFFSDGNIKYDDGIWNVITAYSIDTWYHFKIDFDVADDWHLWINGVSTDGGTGYNFSDPFVDLDYIDRISIVSNLLNTTTNVEAIGYSWDKTHYDNEFFDISSEDAWGTGITWDGTHFWVVGQGGQNVYQYTGAGVYTTVNFHYGTQDIYGTGITWDGTYFYVLGSFSDTVYQYNSTGNYTGFSFSVLSELTHPQGITWDGTYFWVVGKDTDAVFKYNSTGNYTSDTFSVFTQDNNPSDIIWNGVYLYVLGYQTTRVFEYTIEGVYTGYFFSTLAESNSHEGLCYAVDSFWTTEVAYDKAFKYLYVENPYIIGDNMFPVLETNNSLEVDKFEFVFEGIGDVHETGDDNPNGWIDVEDGGDVVSTVNNGDDGWIYWITPETTYSGIKKEDFNLHGDIIEIDFEFQPLYFAGGSSGYTTFMISSYDTSGLVGLRLFNDGVLGYFNGVDYTTLRSDMAINTVYDMNLYICFELELCFMDLYIDGVFDASYDFELVTTGKEGLDTIDITSLMVLEGDSLIFTLNSTAVYSDGVSVAKNYDFGYIEYDLEKPLESWNFENNNLFSINADGYFAIYSSEGTYTAGDSLEILFSENQYDSLVLYNLYDDGETSIDNPFLVVFLSDYAFSNISYISIDGVMVTDGVNDYYLEFSHQNVDINQSYFYIDDNSYLSWSMTMNDNDTEYIQANFDIIDFSDDDYSMYIHGYEYSNGYGYFGVNYADSTSISYSMPTYLSTLNNYLNSQREMTEIVILITDEDDYSTGINTGVIRTIEFRYVANADLSLATLTLTNVMLNLVVILIPSLLFYYAFDKKRDVLLISMILMLTVSFASALIPMWLFFLGLMCMGMFFFIKTDEGSF